ncbi:hypothetical protein PVAND_015539 [Polypedilum vanderplanki]|uniref:BTB domain-containing protein n=1 Tax=Polypedilum vanderplanki TaxID=319348 RepID=A0A9J6BCX8_POLVA|nr:hypothetical protein PVAND_015539 [Polypedilum vanderplanki]
MAKINCEFQFSLHQYTCNVIENINHFEEIKFFGYHKKNQQNKNVKSLNFIDSTLIKIPTNIADNFSNLTWLRFWNCKIEDIEQKHIKNLKNLTLFYVNNCGLKKLKGDLFEGLKNLEYISFANNEIEEIDSKILDVLNLLKYASFRGNKNIDMVFDSRISNGKTLEDFKNEIKSKFQPKLKQLVQPKNDEKTKKIQELMAEISNLKILQQHQEVLIKNQREEIKNLLVKQTKQERIMKEIKNENLNLKKQEKESFQKMFDEEEFKDFTIHVGDSSFKIHKVLFAAHSKILAKIFKENPQAEELNLCDISEATFKIIYDFFYKNHIKENENFIDIFVAASQLKINDLIEFSIEKLLKNINENNFLEILNLSNKFDNKDLQKKAFEIIQSKFFSHQKLDEKLVNQPEKIKELNETKNRNSTSSLDFKKELLEKKYKKLSN